MISIKYHIYNNIALYVDLKSMAVNQCPDTYNDKYLFDVVDFQMQIKDNFRLHKVGLLESIIIEEDMYTIHCIRSPGNN